MTQLLVIAVATFISEDLTCIATGALIAAGKIGFFQGALACVVGIYFGDLLLYFAGRFMGRLILRWRPLRRLLTNEKLDAASLWLEKRGAGVVILSRFTPGLRLPTYVAAGLLKTRFWSFALYFLLAAVLWTPVLVGAAALLGKSLPRLSFAGPAILLVAVPLRKFRPSWQSRRCMVGWFRRRTRWEFWPPWLVYIPLVPYILFQGIKHRSPALFTAANPGIPSGGFVGESKSAMLANLDRVPDFILVSKALPETMRIQVALEFMADRGLSFPIVLKPDVGERGTGVEIVRSGRELASYLAVAIGDTIVQKYVAGMEFGIFYYRYPGEPEGRIFSITEKRFPLLIGDGVSTIAELVLRDERAVCLADLYLGRLKRSADDVPVAGELVPLAELGSHCRGAVFLDGAKLETVFLRSAVDAIARNFSGFHFGRFDVRSESIEDLQNGRFEVLELNGVSAEATHIYDPSVRLLEAYRVLFRQWGIAFEIGATNRNLGHQPMLMRDFIAMLRNSGAKSPSTGSVELRPGGVHGPVHQRCDFGHSNQRREVSKLSTCTIPSESPTKVDNGDSRRDRSVLQAENPRGNLPGSSERVRIPDEEYGEDA
jgi:membrane protein DedA with SNARE-associated domain